VGLDGQPTHYEILQVTPTAERDVIEAAYRRLAQRYHPDVSSDPDAAVRMKRINIAYQVLRDPRRRSDYDLWLETGRRRRLATVARPAEPTRVAEPGTTAAPNFLLVGVAIVALAVVVGLLWPAEVAPWNDGGGSPRAAASPRPGPPAETPTVRAAAPPLALAASPVATPRPVTPTPATANEAWPEAERALAAVWGRDWPRVLALLTEFRVIYPNYQPARERHYAALVAYSQALIDQGQAAEAVEQLERAQAIRPNQGEATALLLALTPAPTPTPGLEARWLATLRQIDPFWGRDWPRVIGPLQDFMVQQPDFAPAVDKLYAALLFYGQELLAQEHQAEAITALERARDLLPDRTEAQVALQALTPTPEPLPPPPPEPRPTPPVVRQPPPVVRQPPPAVRQPQPEVRAPAMAPVVAPTATKVPFPGLGR
jgi:tetratricopeptide (TPR) repeat protein